MKKKVEIFSIVMLFLIIAVAQDVRGGNQFLESTGLKYEKDLEEDLEENEIRTYSYSYYDVTENGTYITEPKFRLSKYCFQPENTALIIMDPWIDNPFEEINDDVKQITTDYLYSITEHAVEKGITVWIISNTPGEYEYNCHIDERLQLFIDQGDAELLIHENINSSQDFCKYLKEHNIENLIYTGFATQICLLFRDSGIMHVYYAKKEKPVNLFCIPEGTMACVSKDERDNTQMRNSIMIMLAQNGIARLITYEDFLLY